MLDDRTKMRDGDMLLLDRINVALRRVTNGEGQMRVPVEATDPDVVLHDCRSEIYRLQERISELEREVVEQARLLGISGSAEARLLARVAELEQQLHIEYQRGWKVGHEVAERDQLLCLARIRAVIGDADGRMTQDELIDRIAAMRKEGGE